MLVYVVRRLGFQALSCSAGAGNWFGAAGWRAGSTGYRRADVVMPHHLGMGRHLFLDVAVTDPGVGAALTARPSPSSSSSGVAAELRAQKKVQKYEELAAAVDTPWAIRTLLEFLIERSRSRPLCLSRKLYGKMNVLAEESRFLARNSRRKRGNRRITARNTCSLKDLVPGLESEQL